MVAFTFLLFLLPVLQASALLIPGGPLVIPIPDPHKILCQLFPSRITCPRAGPPNVSRATALGIAQGVQDPVGAYRFSVKYASASRWQPSTIVNAWNLPNGFTNASAIPLACPQADVDPSIYSEDCLSMILYVPPSLQLLSDAPTLVWIHGGSFVVGSASGPGLDGSKLAIATNSIVAVVQYRLGALGFMAPNGATNLAVKDLVVALQFLKKVVPAFGGSTSKITLAGQSSGANMIRALLGAPSASSLFKSAILQSDPMNFGFLSPTTQSTLQTYFNGLINCGATATACHNSLSLSTILTAQDTLFDNAVNEDPAAGRNQPIRMVLDGTFITSAMNTPTSMASTNKKLLVTSVKDEAAFAIYNMFPQVPPTYYLDMMCSITFGPPRDELVLSSPLYAPVPSLTGGDVDVRVQLQTMGTDYLWKCSAWTFARNWAQSGGTVYVGQYNVGATYPTNAAVSYCTQAGIVCHEDDIQVVFGTTPNPNSAQAALTTEIQARYKAFLNNGNPNAAGVAAWSPATSSDPQPLALGSGPITVGACIPSFWGSEVQYDYQFYNQ